jgi:ribosomal protein S18 acetylase RimI-like enzyme
MFIYKTIDRDNNDFVQELEAGLNSNQPEIPNRNFLNLNIEVLNSNNRIGGIACATYWNWLHIKLLWIAPEYRSKGLGKELVTRAEKEAIQRGCIRALVDTYSFQAPRFYESLGYKKFAELRDFPIGYQRIYFQKDL